MGNRHGVAWSLPRQFCGERGDDRSTEVAGEEASKRSPVAACFRI